MTTAVAISPWSDWDSKMKFADQLVKTGFLPKAVDTAGKALAIIFAGQEIGIPPMHALRSINVIQGKPSLAAELQLALFKQRGGRSKWIRSDADVAEIWLRHPNGDEHTETFTMDDAKRASLVKKDGWQFYPKAMLRARAITAGLRAVAPDIIAGIYDPEELGADVTVDGEIVVPPTKGLEAAPMPFDSPAETEPESGRPEVPTAEDKVPVGEWVKSFEAVQTVVAGRALWSRSTGRRRCFATRSTSRRRCSMRRTA
jgi:hypothetical protein